MVNLELAEVLLIIVVIKLETSVTAALDPFESNVAAAVDLGLQLRVLRADLIDGMACRHLGLFPAAVHLFLFLVKLNNVFDGTLKNGALVLVTVGNQLSDLVDSLIDRLTTTPFH